MFILMISSIVLKLLSAHFLLEHYREKKTELLTILLSLLFICGLIINDFAAINFFLKTSVTASQWFMTLLTVFISFFLFLLMMRIKQIKNTAQESHQKNENNQLRDLLNSPTLASSQSPMIIINKEKKILHMTENFKRLIGHKDGLEKGIDTTLDTLFGRRINIEEVLRLNKSVEGLVGLNKDKCHCKVSAYISESSQLIALVFEDYSEQVSLLEEKKVYKDRVAYYEETLKVGQWTYNFSDNRIYYSKEVQRLLDLKSDSISYDGFRKLLHPEDLMFIDILDGKTLWVSGLHRRYILIKCGQHMKYATIHYQPINDDKGLPIGAKGLIQEISNQRDYIATQLIKERNDHISSILVELDKYLTPLLSRLKNEKTIPHLHKELHRILEKLEDNKKVYSQGKHKNLISVDKLVEENVHRFSAVCDRFDIELSLKSQHILLAMDEMSFKQMLSHLLTEFTKFQYRVPLRIKTLGQEGLFNFKCELGIHPMLGEFAYGFKQKLLTPPWDVEDASLFHVYTIIKRFNGTIHFYVDNSHYGINISFPAIHMMTRNLKKHEDVKSLS